jgi:hypothetical protein
MVTLMSSHSVNAAGRETSNDRRPKEITDKQGAEIAQGFRINDPTRILGEGRIQQDRTLVYDNPYAYGSYYGNPYGAYNYNYPAYSAYPNPYVDPYYGAYYYNPGMYNPNTTFVNPPDPLNYPTGYPGYSETYYYGR